MPTKENGAGKQQEYIPAGNGDKSGEFVGDGNYSFTKTTKFSKYDDLLKGEHDNRKANIRYMTPDEYITACGLYGFKDSRYSYNELIESRNDDALKQLILDIKQSKKIDLPYINYADNTQEGLHRALACKELGMQKIPVVEVHVVDERKERENKYYEEANDILHNVNKQFADMKNYEYNTDDFVDEITDKFNYISHIYDSPKSKVEVDAFRNKVYYKINGIQMFVSYDITGNSKFKIKNFGYSKYKE